MRLVDVLPVFILVNLGIIALILSQRKAISQLHEQLNEIKSLIHKTSKTVSMLKDEVSRIQTPPPPPIHISGDTLASKKKVSVIEIDADDEISDSIISTDSHSTNIPVDFSKSGKGSLLQAASEPKLEPSLIEKLIHDVNEISKVRLNRDVTLRWQSAFKNQYPSLKYINQLPNGLYKLGERCKDINSLLIAVVKIDNRYYAIPFPGHKGKCSWLYANSREADGRTIEKPAEITIAANDIVKIEEVDNHRIGRFR